MDTFPKSAGVKNVRVLISVKNVISFSFMSCDIENLKSLVIISHDLKISIAAFWRDNQLISQFLIHPFRYTFSNNRQNFKRILNSKIHTH